MTRLVRIALVALMVCVFAFSTSAQQAGEERESLMDSRSRERTLVMLRQAQEHVRKYYFDPTFKGRDLDAQFKAYDAKIRTARTLNEGLALVAAFLDELDDSHTFFVPPARPYDFDYGYALQAYGSAVRVSQIRPGSAAASRLRIGDEVTAVNGVPVTRGRLRTIWRVLALLSPQPATQLTIRAPDGATRDVVIPTRTRPGRRQLDLTSLNGEDIWQLIRQSEMYAREMRHEYVSTERILIWKMPEFAMDRDGLNQFFAVVRKHDALILDLRGNPGGAETTLLGLIGGMFPKDVTVAELRTRAGAKPLVAKGAGANAYLGEVVVLVDAESGSAAEMFARVMQLEGRGTVIGDRTAGSVMQSLGYVSQQGLETVISYFFSVTTADAVMKDGTSLEHVGVTPTVLVVPTATDLAAGHDPALSRAVAMLGRGLSPEDAGKMFPFRWRPF